MSGLMMVSTLGQLSDIYMHYTGGGLRWPPFFHSFKNHRCCTFVPKRTMDVSENGGDGMKLGNTTVRRFGSILI